MAYVMFVLGRADGRPAAPVPVWVERYDLDYAAGIGAAWLTDDITKAQRWESAGELLDAWRSVSQTMPLRPDGKPNRPLTAYSISPMKVEA